MTLRPDAPEPPANLDREAKAEWRRVVAELDGMGLLARIDRAVLTIYADAWQKHGEARKILDAEGVVVEDKYRGVVKHPAWQVYQQSGNTVAALAKELFASPMSRLRSHLPEGRTDDQDEAADLLD